MDEHGWPFLSRRPRHCKGDGQVQARAPYLLAGRRLGAGRGPGASARSWLQAGSLPSTLVRWAQSWSRRLAAKACNAAWVNMAVQRLMRAAATECWRRCGACRALACARSVTNLAASSLHLPPVSMPRTTSRHRRLWRSSGYVRSFLRRASINAVPAYCPALRRGCPSLVSGETMVVSTASWAPPQTGRPFAITSMRRSFCRWMWSRFKSVSRVLVVTRAPASRHMRAVARSKVVLRFRRIPDCAHAARWSPKVSRVRRHRQWRAVRGMGRRKRRRMRIRNKWVGYSVSMLYGIVVKLLLAWGPCWDASRAWLAGSRRS